MRSEISKPNKNSFQTFQAEVFNELKSQEEKLSKESRKIEKLHLGEELNDSIEIVATTREELAKQNIASLFQSLSRSKFLPTPQTTLNSPAKSVSIKHRKNWDPTRYELKYFKSQAAAEDFETPAGFDDETVRRLMNGENVQIVEKKVKKTPLSRIGDVVPLNLSKKPFLHKKVAHLSEQNQKIQK